MRAEWNPEDDPKLLELNSLGKSASQMCKYFGWKTPKTIRNRLEKLGVKYNYVYVPHEACYLKKHKVTKGKKPDYSGHNLQLPPSQEIPTRGASLRHGVIV